MAGGRPSSLLTIAGLLGVLLIFGSIYSLVELHIASADQAEHDDTRQGRFATEFKLVSRAIKRAWRQSLVASDDSDNVDVIPPAERLGQCVVYPNTDMWGMALNDGSRNIVQTAGECCEQCDKTKGMVSQYIYTCAHACIMISLIHEPLVPLNLMHACPTIPHAPHPPHPP